MGKIAAVGGQALPGTNEDSDEHVVDHCLPVS